MYSAMFISVNGLHCIHFVRLLSIICGLISEPVCLVMVSFGMMYA
jgi:hypothetical protein